MTAAHKGRFRVESLDHVELFVPDRFAAASWYQRVLGLEIIESYRHWAVDPEGPLMISSDGGATKLALFTGEPQGPRTTVGYHLVAWRVSGAEFLRFCRHAAELGLRSAEGRAVKPSSMVDHGKAFSVYFCDPFGHRLEITTYEHEVVRTAKK